MNSQSKLKHCWFIVLAMHRPPFAREDYYEGILLQLETVHAHPEHTIILMGILNYDDIMHTIFNRGHQVQCENNS